jgi:hypothetical protein
MSIIIQSHRRRLDNIKKDFLGAIILDVTSHGKEPWIKFSPFYPHGKVIPVSFYPLWKSQTVEGIWQGLKVFESEGIDYSRMQIKDMTNIKRTVRKYGQCKGHKAGDQLLTYGEARKLIYLPTYLWVLENCLAKEVEELRKMSANQTVILLDYETNGDVENLRKPLSHAYLIKYYVEGNYPDFQHSVFIN